MPHTCAYTMLSIVHHCACIRWRVELKSWDHERAMVLRKLFVHASVLCLEGVNTAMFTCLLEG